MNVFKLSIIFAMSCLPLFAGVTPVFAEQREKILIVVSGEGREQGKTRPGYEFDELSQAWLIFRNNGLDVEVASPQGGAVEADRYNAAEPFNAELLADANVMRVLANTRATGELDARNDAAVYVVGGKGAMLDLPKDENLRRLLSSVWDNGGIVAAVCHGPTALVEVKISDGSLLVPGKSLTGFSKEDESVFGKKWAKTFPWLLEDAMRERGVRWQEAPPMISKLVVDGRLITGQNPYSTTAVAEAVIVAMGRMPVARAPWRDEETMKLVMQRLDGNAEEATAKLHEDQDRYHVDLIGTLGYYQLRAADAADAIRDSIAIMELARPYMDQPQLVLGIAESHSRLGDKDKARDMLQDLMAKSPDMPEAKAMLDQLGA